MARKDCDRKRSAAARRNGWSLLPAVVACAALWLAGSDAAYAGSVRVWPKAVVTSDSIRLDDICLLQGFDRETEQRLARTEIGDAPQAGGSRIVHLEMIRTALASQGANLATVTISGSIRCEVTRPGTDQSQGGRDSRTRGEGDRVRSDSSDVQGDSRSQSPDASARRRRDAQDDDERQRSTLRQAVVDHFHQRLARFDGTAEIVFDRTDEQVLDLSGPEYSFQVRGSDAEKLGLVSTSVDVFKSDGLVQTVPLVVQVVLVRPTVVARRAINQDAEIQSADVEVAPLRYTSITRLGLTDAARVVGQRAKRLIRAGSIIDPDMLEEVPLVVRGQLVSIASVAGGVRVVTSGKATSDGLFGDVITVRPTDDRKVELDAVVVGSGKVQIGGNLPVAVERVASREGGS